MNRSCIIACLCLGSLALGCGTVQVPAAAPPSKIVPTLMSEPGPRVDGAGRVVLDVPGERARVVEITGATSGVIANQYGATNLSSIATRVVCITPCVANLEYGQHELAFVSQTEEDVGSIAIVDVGPKTSVFRHAMGRTTKHPTMGSLGTTATSLSATGALTGLSIYLVGALLQDSDSSKGADPTKYDGLKDAGLVTMGISAAVLATGIVLLVLAREERQPGSSTQFIPVNDAPESPATTVPSVQSVFFRY